MGSISGRVAGVEREVQKCRRAPSDASGLGECFRGGERVNWLMGGEW